MSCIERVVARTAAQASARMPPPVLQQSSDMLARLATTGSLPASSTTAQCGNSDPPCFSSENETLALSFSEEWPLLSCRRIGRQQRHRWISLALRLSETVGLVCIVCLSHRVAGAGRGRTRRPAAPSACAATPRPSGSPCPNDDCQMSLRCQSSSVDRFAQEWLCSDIAPCAYTGRH